MLAQVSHAEAVAAAKRWHCKAGDPARTSDTTLANFTFAKRQQM